MPSAIALDAMGSDRAPRPEIEGAIAAVRHLGMRVLLVGPEDRLRAELARHRWVSELPLEIVHASEVITMEDKAAQAVRSKRDSTMRVGVRLVREGRAAGFVTAGNTGAAMATAKMVPLWRLCFPPRSAPAPCCWTWAPTWIASRTTLSSLL
jgi:phosphate acyltransferase